jgi:hypothetical protein
MATTTTSAAHAYSPVHVIWPYASAPHQCLVQSEQAWLTTWAELIRCPILTKKRGWVTVEDWNEVAMGVAQVS